VGVTKGKKKKPARVKRGKKYAVTKVVEGGGALSHETMEELSRKRPYSMLAKKAEQMH